MSNAQFPIGLATDSVVVKLAQVEWVTEVPGIRSRETHIGARRWAIVEYSSGTRRAEWCHDGHAGLVLSGCVEYEFEDGGPRLTASDGDVFTLATGRPHRGTNLSEGATLLFLIDDPA